MDYIDKIVFRMFKTLTDEQKYDLLEKLTLENKELKEQLNSSGVVKPLKVKKKLEILDWMEIYYKDRSCLEDNEEKELETFVNELKELIYK